MIFFLDVKYHVDVITISQCMCFMHDDCGSSCLSD